MYTVIAKQTSIFYNWFNQLPYPQYPPYTSIALPAKHGHNIPFHNAYVYLYQRVHSLDITDSLNIPTLLSNLHNIYNANKVLSMYISFIVANL